MKNPAVRTYKQCVTRGLPHSVPLEGMRLVEDALAAGILLDTLYLSEDIDVSAEAVGGRILSQARRAGAKVVMVSRSVAERMADTRTPQGVFALARWKPLSGSELLAQARQRGRPSFGVFLDGVSDPGNVGTIIRTAAALGASGVMAGPRCAGLTNPKVVRASMGSMFRMPVAQISEVEEFLLHAAGLGCEVIVSDAQRGVGIERLVWPVFGSPAGRGGQEDASSQRGLALLVVGSEADGVSNVVRSHATAWVKIEMARDVESLNVAAAAAILMYVLRQKALDWQDEN
jgi:TrmH family RNA methyltransferase